MQSLRRLVRGLSLLFWGLPFTLLVSAQSAVTEWLRPMGILPPVFGNLMMLAGLVEMSRFQKTERPWQLALDRAQILGFINVGLSPFIFWWNRMPNELVYLVSISILAVSSLLFLVNLNFVLQRLAAMLPDESLRSDTHLFTSLNLGLMLGVILLIAAYFGLEQIEGLPQIVGVLMDRLFEARRPMILFLVLLPLAMTMTLLWKVKDVVMASVFGPRN
jgi:hypothetical protein